MVAASVFPPSVGRASRAVARRRPRSVGRAVLRRAPSCRASVPASLWKLHMSVLGGHDRARVVELAAGDERRKQPRRAGATPATRSRHVLDHLVRSATLRQLEVVLLQELLHHVGPERVRHAPFRFRPPSTRARGPPSVSHMCQRRARPSVPQRRDLVDAFAVPGANPPWTTSPYHHNRATGMQLNTSLNCFHIFKPSLACPIAETGSH